MQTFESPLSDATTFLEDKHRIPFVLDYTSIEEIGVTADTPITINVEGISLRSALNLMLKRLELAWVIRDEVLLITTRKEAKAAKVEPISRIYDVGDLIRTKDERGKENRDARLLIELIHSAAGPAEAWPERTESAMWFYAADGLDVLVIRQTRPIHDEIANLLGTLRAVRRPGEPVGEAAKRMPNEEN